MTIAEYNKQFCPKISKAYCFINNLEHAAEKTDNYEETMKQLLCIGWDDECKEIITDALESYKKLVKEQLIRDIENKNTEGTDY